MDPGSPLGRATHSRASSTAAAHGAGAPDPARGWGHKGRGSLVGLEYRAHWQAREALHA